MPKQKIAVLHALTDRNVGGAGVLLSSLLAESDRDAFRYGVILPKDSAIAPRLQASGAILYRLPIRERSFSPRDLLYYRQAIADFSPDILQTHGALTARLAALLTSEAPFALVTRHCVFRRFRARHPLVGRLSALAEMPLTHAVIATAACADRLAAREGFDPARILMIPNGVPVLRPPDPSEKRLFCQKHRLNFPFTVGFCARIEKEKNPFFLVRLAEALRDRSEIGFLVIGDGSLLPSLRQAVSAAHLDAHFRFTGYTDNVSLPLSCTDIQLNASLLSETTCLSLLEGFSLGIPALAPPIGGNLETVRAHINGLFYPPNRAKECAAMLRTLIRHPATLEKLGRGAREIYEHEYRADLTARRYEAFYRALIKNKER